MLADDLKHALDPSLFASEVLGIAPDAWQAEVLKSNAKRQILNCCRQSGKSTIAAIMSLQRVLFFPGSLVLLVSPSLRQSSELFRKVSDFLGLLDERPRLLEDNKLSLALDNGSRVVSLPSKEGTVRGYSGVSLIIEDEAARVPDDLYRAIRPMLAVSGGQIVLMSTPFGKRGHFFDEWENGADTWYRTRIVAAECPRISDEFLEEEKAALGSHWYAQEYECRFVETVDHVFGYDLVMSAISSDVKPLFG